MTLDEAIEQQINLGQKDPLTIVEKVTELYGEKWLRKQVSAFAADVAAEIARTLVRSQARKSEMSIRPGDPITSSEMQLKGMWIPGEHGYSVWKRFADLTAFDLRARAKWYDAFAMGALKRGHWLREVADLVESEGAETVGQLRHDLPALPEEDEVRLALVS